MALGLAREGGADHSRQSRRQRSRSRVLALTEGNGAEAVIDFVGEGDAVANGLTMTRNAGYYYIVGYGGKVEIPTMDMIVSEKTIVGNLVGTYPDLVELMALADRGLVNLATKEYRLSEANQALHDSEQGQGQGTRGADSLTIVVK